MSGDAAYRRELELELERLTKELADVRVEKAQQKQRIEQLSMEQTQLKEQLVSGTKKERRTDLAAQLQSLHSVVKQKKQEHAQVKQEWERSQEQYQQMKQTVGLLQESAQHAVLQDVDEHDDVAAWTRSSNNNNADTMSLATDNESFAWENDGDYSTVDGDSTVITEHTKDSLQVYRQKRAAQRAASSGASTSSAQSGLGKFLQRGDGTSVDGTATEQLERGSRASSGKLGSHLQKGGSSGKKSKSRDNGEVSSAAE